MEFSLEHKSFITEFYKENPDIKKLKLLIEKHGIDLNLYRDEYGSTFLNIAADERRSYELVKLLLEHGADPNIALDEENGTVLWNMQYAGNNNQDDYIDTRTYEDSVRITELLLQYGADPSSVCDNESIYHEVVYEVFNEPDFEFEYYTQFLTLLIVYGEEKLKDYLDYKKPFNKEIALAYRLRISDAGDGYHLKGEVYGPSGEIFAVL